VKRNVTVLGINDGHEASAALMRNGSVLAALQEERPLNIKHFSGLPETSIREVFRTAGVPPSEIDLIAISNLSRLWQPKNEYSEYSRRVRFLFRTSSLLASDTFAKLYTNVSRRFRNAEKFNKIFSELGIQDKEVMFVEHHLGHAATAYWSSPWPLNEPVLVLTADGSGDGLSSTVNVGRNGDMERIASSTFYDSLGIFYGEITAYLGMKRWDHEYKVMGLAPYGRPDTCIHLMREIIRAHPSKPLRFQNRLGAYDAFSIQKKMRKMFVGQRFDNLAAGAQEWLEQIITTWVKSAIKETNLHKIACAGGVFLNVKANKRILEMPEVEDAFFYPAAGDEALAIGAALEAYRGFCARDGFKPEKVPLKDLYYGPSYSNERIEEVLKSTGWAKKAQFYDGVDEVIGEQVPRGKIAARFSGRVEFGPRALGNRSILADARDLNVVRKINFAIKQRDFWMPFAATILEDSMKEYLVNPRSAPYMILAFDTTGKRNEIIAALHPFDQTCRPQTLNDSWNPGYRKTIESFREQTGIGGLLNTSFNLHGSPIVCTPEQALWTFENSSLDALAIGNYVVTK